MASRVDSPKLHGPRLALAWEPALKARITCHGPSLFAASERAADVEHIGKTADGEDSTATDDEEEDTL